MRFLAALYSELRHILAGPWLALGRWLGDARPFDRILMLATTGSTILVCILVARNVSGFALQTPEPDPVIPEPPADPAPPPPTWRELIDFTEPVRDAPDRFKAGSHRPAIGEGAASTSIDRVSFDPDRDLIWVDDDRVWWESENDDHTGDTEDDHVMHWAIEEPFRRLIELVDQEGGTIKVQDSYRDAGIHASRSLHKQGRALDLTAMEMSLSRLAALAWAAGFDWVYYELKGGAHIHASVSVKDKRRLCDTP